MSRVTKYLRYTLKLNAPAIVSTLSSDPNSSVTQPFIPGGVIRGVLASELLSAGVPPESNEFRRLILDGDVRFLHAYPSERSDRCVPFPVPWREEKGTDNGTMFDLAGYSGEVQPDSFSPGDNGTLEMDPDDIWPAVSLRRAKYAFIELGSTKHGVRVRTDTRINQQRDRNKGRSWKTVRSDRSEEAHGALFAYEFLERDQIFQGMFQVWGDSADDANTLIETIKARYNDRQIFIGRSRRAGYGGAATITFGATEAHELAGGDVQQNDLSVGAMFRACLLSSCIVRDTVTGQLDPASLSVQLQQLLGGANVAQVERVLWDFESVGGFNRKWQLEVPQALALKAGSVLVLRANQAIPATTLRQIEHAGLGERRIEGFGRLVFLKHSDELSVTVKASEARQEQATPPTGDPPELITFLQRRMLDAAFNRSLERQVRTILDDVKKPPTGSLLGRLRVPLRSGDPAAGLQTLQQWLAGNDDAKDRTKLKKEARNKLRECQFSNTTLFEWLCKPDNSQGGKSPAIEAAIEIAKFVARPKRNQLVGNNNDDEPIDGEREAAYAVQLIDAVLATLARQTRLRKREGSR